MSQSFKYEGEMKVRVERTLMGVKTLPLDVQYANRALIDNLRSIRQLDRERNEAHQRIKEMEEELALMRESVGHLDRSKAQFESVIRVAFGDDGVIHFLDKVETSVGQFNEKMDREEIFQKELFRCQ